MGHPNSARIIGSMAVAMATILGCSDTSVKPSASPPYETDRSQSTSLVASRRGAEPATKIPADAAPRTEAEDKSKAPAENERSATAGRKILYNATVDLVCEDLNALDATLTRLVAARKAYIADSERSGVAGTTRHGSWKVRVPVQGYDDFLKGVVGLGELVSLKAESQDVSEEYFDLDAHQAAKKVEEARLLKHLTDSTGKLEEILAVERELSRVRSEIERMQGRLRVLSNLAELATVTITASEIKGYVPPQAPTLSTRIGRTFSLSLDALRQFGEAVLLCVVGIAPWLPLVALVMGIFFWATRHPSRPASPAASVEGAGLRETTQ